MKHLVRDLTAALRKQIQRGAVVPWQPQEKEK